jgi:hypothetical protein
MHAKVLRVAAWISLQAALACLPVALLQYLLEPAIPASVFGIRLLATTVIAGILSVYGLLLFPAQHWRHADSGPSLVGQIAGIMVLLILSFRLIALPFYVAAIGASLGKRFRIMTATWTICIALSASPIDIGLLTGPNSTVYGRTRTGLRVVHALPGCMPVIPVAVAEHGECARNYSPSAYRPTWIVIWW